MKISNRIFYMFLLSLLISCGEKERPYIGYDPNKDPFQQLQDSQSIAKKEDKLILVISGGEWCRWCYVLDGYLKDNESIHQYLKDTFVITKVYVGNKNKNKAFFDTIPKAKGAPFFWVFSQDGRVIQTLNTALLEEGGDSYNRKKFLTFIKYFDDYTKAPKQKTE